MWNEEKKAQGDLGLSEVIQKNRKAILGCITGAALLCVGFVVTMVVLDYANKSALKKLEGFTSRYMDILKGDEYAALPGNAVVLEMEKTEGGEKTAAAKDEPKQLESFMVELTDFAARHSGYPAAEAWLMLGHLHSKKTEWQQAEASYLNAAKAGKKTHIAPAALFNAAVAAEEQGKSDLAIDHYASSVAYPEFAHRVRAQFSIGRLYEKTDVSAAIEAYKVLVNDWGESDNWTALAHSRLIALENSRNNP